MYNISKIAKEYKSLTLKEEQEMCKKYANDPETLQNKLILHNICLVHLCVFRTFWWVDNEKKDEYISIGIQGLIKAAKNFDYTKGFKFSTYASIVIKRHIQRETTPNQIEKNTYYLQTPLKSTKTGEEEDDRDVETLIYKDIDPEYIKIKETSYYVEKDSKKDLIHSLIKDMNKMCRDNVDKKNLNIFIDYYGIGQGNGKDITLQSIGNKYNLTKERIRQIVSKMMFKVRKHMIQKYDLSDKKKFNQMFHTVMS